MKAKDTVMSTEQLLALLGITVPPQADEARVMLNSDLRIAKDAAKAQAETTWNIASTYGFEVGLAQGRRGVVAWGDEVCHQHSISNKLERRRECKQCWQEQKKEWGIK